MADSKCWATVIKTHAIISDMNKRQEHEADIIINDFCIQP